MAEETSWLEVALVVDGELAEAVAEVLARFAPNGVVIESTAVTASPDDTEGHAVGPLRVKAYLRMNAALEETRRKLEEALWYLGRIRPLPDAEYRPVTDTNWAEAWKQHYHPIAIGQRLMIVPAWLEPETGGRVPLRIDPGMAFGTGTHPTTQLCLEWVEELLGGKLRSNENDEAREILRFAQDDDVTQGDEIDVIDVGCGSGILSAAALKLGARQALGVDIDPDAVDAARENAVLNGVDGRMELGLGSLADILSNRFALRQAHLVLANILAPVLVRLLDEGLAGLVLPGGVLVLSGLLDTQADEVLGACRRVGLQPAGQKQIADWVALAVTKPA